MVHVVFEYRDNWSRGKWNRQECYVPSLEECKKIYGLGVDCEYKIIRVDGEEETRSNTRSSNGYRGTRLSPYERTRNAVYATGNKWAIENFNATH